MPIYEYTCTSCKKSFEHLQRTMSDGPKPACPECGSKQTARQLSVFAVAADTAKSVSSGDGPPTCGRCGGAPGSCGMD
jgi:putative FmdB family regulatory protein